MFRLKRFLGYGVIAALAVAAAAGLAMLVDPTPSAESAISAATAPARPATTPAPPMTPAVAANFVDRFSDVDSSRWAVSDGWSNGAWVENNWRRDQLQVTREGLAITMAPNLVGEDKPYASGEIATHQTFSYGYFEARMRVPRGPGVVTGVFTFARPQGNSSWHEIDMEIVGRDTRTLELAYHVEGRPKKQVIHLPFDAAAGFHTYAFEWRPDAIRWYVDNVLVHEARGGRVERLSGGQRFIVNLWNTEQLYRWTGRIRPSEAPWTLTVACVAQAPAYSGRALCPERDA